ncbi:carboxypeptidase-like regulatory domain-containing protein [Cupriavidus basilensis]|uniref:carboxypeptidase-like regulatory domain-containing protein n=1 Tax=Cupriavidus basilensis TaxID=68895 RepID=UPI0020A6AA69|nr:carboxypeptidase-like regulatory domain-containing protein [Cupriavidus basilensis]MCP3024026.1 carboxypeptidase-like regulatory domain-containing protein [Cupriavidus basilensis]
MNGTIIDTSGGAVTTLAGRLVALRGTSDGVRRVVEIDSNGKFTIPNLIADTYEASILDTEFPGLSSATIQINPSTKTASVTIVYGAPSR